MEFINEIIERKKSGRNIVVAEIGVGFGASTLLACLKLSSDDVYYCFDFRSSIVMLLEDLKRIEEIRCEIIGIGNSTKTFDSYNWSLSNLIFKMRNQNEDGMFDVCYLDGAHDFARDGLAICLLKQLMKIGGTLILDDVILSLNQWALPEYIEQNFTPEQSEDLQILRAQKIFLESDPNFQQISKTNAYRGIFKRIN